MGDKMSGPPADWDSVVVRVLKAIASRDPVVVQAAADEAFALCRDQADPYSRALAIFAGSAADLATHQDHA